MLNNLSHPQSPDSPNYYLFSLPYGYRPPAYKATSGEESPLVCVLSVLVVFFALRDVCKWHNAGVVGRGIGTDIAKLLPLPPI